MAKIEKFEDLEVWKLSVEVIPEIYTLIKNNSDFCKDFALASQIKRSIISVSSNIAEGFEKNNNIEFRRYLKIAKGSAGEARNQTYIAYILNYVNKEDFDKVTNSLIIISSKLSKLIDYLNLIKKENKFLSR